MVPLWGLGVRSRLLLAFFGITAFAVLAALRRHLRVPTGGRAARRRERPRSSRPWPRSSSPDRPSVSSRPRRPCSLRPDRKRRDEVKAQLEGEVATLKTKLLELQQDRSEVLPLDRIEPVVTSLTDNLAALEDIVARRLDTNDRVKTLMRGVFQANDAMRRLLAPWLMVMESQISR